MATVKMANAQLWVHDQDEALEFWTKKVGFEVRQDVGQARENEEGSHVQVADYHCERLSLPRRRMNRTSGKTALFAALALWAAATASAQEAATGSGHRPRIGLVLSGSALTLTGQFASVDMSEGAGGSQAWLSHCWASSSGTGPR